VEGRPVIERRGGDRRDGDRRAGDRRAGQDRREADRRAGREHAVVRHEAIRPGGLVAPPSSRGLPDPESLAFAPDDRFLVVMPTYNEVDNLPRIVPLVLDEDTRIEILVVDDNSPDGTGELAAEMAIADPRIHVLRRQAKDGLGRAYLAGFRWALERRYRLIFEMDADLSHHPDNLPAFIEAARGADVVIGSRYVGGRINVVNWPMSRLLISYFGSFYARVITRLPVADATGGFNCFRCEVLQALDLGRIQANGYAFQIELKFRAFRQGFRLCEVPIVFIERETGESKMSKRIVREAVWRVWWLRIQDLAGRL
jgi:dolichol-phosphate mannosyltransferase